MNTLKVLHIASEVAPFAKVGGLADVIGVLPGELRKLGTDARVVMPLYKQIKDAYADRLQFRRYGSIRMGWREQYSGLYEMDYEGVHFYFIDNEYYFGHDQIYLEYTFDIERFSFFQRAVLEAMGMPMDFWPDILHCNDWQSGLVPVLMQAHYWPYGFFRDVKTVFTIHNLEYQGIHGADYVSDLCDLSEDYMNEFGVLHDGAANFMKAGIVYANAVTTVSQTYSEEIMTSFFGEGLDYVLQSFRFKISGIINGIDMELYDPKTDKRIEENFDFASYKKIKPRNKRALQEEFGLEQTDSVPLLAMITRLVDQKGLDLLLPILDELLEEDIQVIVLGTGEQKYEDRLNVIAARHGKNMRAAIRFDGALAQRIYAGSDMFLMPSIFEPCGLSQMISMRYGTIPIVRETGGLRDTIVPYNQYTGAGDGFSFANINAHEFLFVTKEAIDIWRAKDMRWHNLVKNAMAKDFSWTLSAKKYIDLFDSLIRKAKERHERLAPQEQKAESTAKVEPKTKAEPKTKTEPKPKAKPQTKAQPKV